MRESSFPTTCASPVAACARAPHCDRSSAVSADIHRIIGPWIHAFRDSSMMRGARGLFLAAATTVLVCAAMYWLPQYWHRGEPALLPLTALDRLIPFWPVS